MSTIRAPRCLIPLITLGLTMFPSTLHAAGLGNLFSGSVSISFQHPPDLGFSVKSIAFASPTGDCSGEFVDLLIEDFLRSRIEVIEREQIDTILREIDFSSSGYIRPEDMKPLGEVMGASALIFVHVQRCSTEHGRDHKTSTNKKGSTTTYYSTTTSHFKTSIRVVDTLTGKVHSAKVLQESERGSNSSRSGYPEFPDAYAVKDAAIRATVVKVHRMLLPWLEIDRIRFFKEEKCGLKEAFRLVEVRNYGGALEKALESVESCKALPKPKPKLQARAHYNVGAVHLLNRNNEAALTYFRQAHSIRPTGTMKDAVNTAQKAMSLAQAMDRFQDANVTQASREPQLGASKKPAEEASTEATKRPVSERLKELENLLKEGLITEPEFREMRQEVLSKI